jgi:hypothetical protein
MDNEYIPLKVKMSVDDKRSKKERALKVPINFTWNIKPLEGI